MFCDLSNKERREKKVKSTKILWIADLQFFFSFLNFIRERKKTRESDGGPLSHRWNRKEVTKAMEDTSNLSWIDSYNTSWTREDLYLILSYGGTQYLYEKLVSNGEIENSVNLSNRQNQTIKPTRKASRYEKIC